MSETTVRFPAGVADGVAAYVREVRVELADLPAEDVDDLTGGMEADLSELAAESGGDLIGRLGTPSVYAAELRAAAGLPARVTGPRRQRGSLSRATARARVSFARLTGQHPWLRSAVAYLVTLRPAWWLVRGYLAAWALWSMLSGSTRGVRPHSFLQLVLVLTAIVISVQLGRGRLGQRAGLRPLLVVANSALVVVALVASISVDDVQYVSGSDFSQPVGVSLDGTYVRNIYAYDSEGKRISSVRLFTQDGRPLGGADNAIGPNGNEIGVVRDGSGALLTNVYPRALFGPDPWQVIDPADPAVNPDQWTPPMSILPLMPNATPGSTASGAATTPAPTASAPPAPSKSSRPAPGGSSASVTPSGG
jgi:hypothetical protein